MGSCKLIALFVIIRALKGSLNLALNCRID
jgi:hypothetical protein